MTKVSTAKRGRPVASSTGRPRRASILLATLVLLGGCQLGEVDPPAPVLPALEGPSIEAGPPDTDPSSAAEAARLLSEGEEALARGDAGGAIERAGLVRERFSRVPGSAAALLLEARAEVERGGWEAAEAASLAFMGRHDAGTALHAEGALVLARARIGGELPGAVESLFDIPPDAPVSVLRETEELAWAMAEAMAEPVLRDLVDEAPRHASIFPVFATELAVRRALVGDVERARGLASEALSLSPGDRTRERATEVVEGRLEGLAERVLSISAVLSQGGPPSLQQLSARIRAGVEVALAGAGLPPGTTVSLSALDDEGMDARVPSLVRQAEDEAAIGLVGPLLEPALEAGARARTRGLPMISPTARMLPPGEPGVYTLNGIDPAASRELAALALRAGVRDVAVLRPMDRAMEEAARHFREAFEAGGGTIRRTLTFVPGTTTLAEPFREVLQIGPSGLVMFLHPDEVEIVAPQVAYFGVDELEIRILGNESFASPAVLQEINPRHTDGVLTVTSREPSGDPGPGWRDFVEAYEAHFQRTLRDATPALGYDAARLLLHAWAEGGGSSEGMVRALEGLRDYPGASGLLSWNDGGLQRRFRAVQIEGRTLVPFEH